MAFAIALGLSERVGLSGATGGGSALRDDPADRRGPTILPRVLMLPRVLREIDPRSYSAGRRTPDSEQSPKTMA